MRLEQKLFHGCKKQSAALFIVTDMNGIIETVYKLLNELTAYLWEIVQTRTEDDREDREEREGREGREDREDREGREGKEDREGSTLPHTQSWRGARFLLPTKI
jgi:hypothetical protein